MGYGCGSILLWHLFVPAAYDIHDVLVFGRRGGTYESVIEFLGKLCISIGGAFCPLPEFEPVRPIELRKVLAVGEVESLLMVSDVIWFLHLDSWCLFLLLLLLCWRDRSRLVFCWILSEDELALSWLLLFRLHDLSKYHFRVSQFLWIHLVLLLCKYQPLPPHGEAPLGKCRVGQQRAVADLNLFHASIHYIHGIHLLFPLEAALAWLVMNIPQLISGASLIIKNILLASVQENRVSHGLGHGSGVPLRLLELLRALDLLLDFVIAQTDQVGF